MRAFRIILIASVFALLFRLSQWAGEVRGNEPVPGLSWAIGVLSVLFLVRAVVTEMARGAEMNLQKDFLWGLSIGGVVTVGLRALS